MAEETSNVSLLAYFERLLKEHEHWAVEKFAALDRALALAREEDNKKFHNLNELRREVTQDRSILLSREVYEAEKRVTLEWRKMIEGECNSMTNRITALETKVAVWAAVLAVIMVLVQLASHFLWRG